MGIQCAKIAVEEIKWEILKYADSSREYVKQNSDYWQEVLKCLNKL